MKKLIIPILSFFLLVSCEKTITLDLEQAPPVVVIEGLVTDEFTQHEILISQTNQFSDKGENPKISGATVLVTDDEGGTFYFEEKEAGRYRSIDSFAGVVGRTYTMDIAWGEERYTASETLQPIFPFDSTSIRINLEEQADPEDEGRFYEVLAYLTEPKDRDDWYMVKFFRNGEPETENGTLVYVFDDLALSEEIEALPAPVFYAEGDVARVEFYSLNRRAYKYYFDLANNVNNDGGMFSGQPANVGTNISGDAIGYFQVSGISVVEIEVK